jgi:hypothetical protein
MTRHYLHPVTRIPPEGHKGREVPGALSHEIPLAVMLDDGGGPVIKDKGGIGLALRAPHCRKIPFAVEVDLANTQMPG